MTQRYNLDLVLGFVNAFGSNKTPTDEQIKAARHALEDVLMDGIDLRKELGLSRKRGQRKKCLMPPRGTAKSREVSAVVTAFVSKRITYPIAVGRVEELCHCSKRTAQRYIQELKPDAEKFLRSFAFFKALAVKR